MKHWVGEIIGIDLLEVPGARLSGSFPFTEALVNRLCADYLPASSAIASLVVEFRDNDRITARVKVRAPFVPRLTVHARIERQPDPARSVPLVLAWSIGGLGSAAALAAFALRRLVKLPPWIQLEPETVAVDVGGFIGARGYGEIVPYVAGLHLSSTEGRLVVEFELLVSPRPA